MKKIRKGFTLVELLIVIAVIGILSSMAMMGGSEANNIANANKIIEEFRIIGAAMNMYYADNRSGFEAALDTDNSETYAKRIKEGIAAYMKNTDAIVDDNATVGKYLIVVDGSSWWLQYQLPLADTKLAKILANKAAEFGLKKEVKKDTTPSTETDPNKKTYGPADAYASDGVDVFYQVR